MKNHHNKDIERSLISEIKGSGFREMKNRFRKISNEFEDENVSSILSKLPSAAFGGFAKVARNPLPVTDQTLKDFLGEDEKEKKRKKRG